ncbi:Os08g0238650 [Oryza sativa Japonica Group]|jgi:hypothetical protein|uniref:Os08g0238650 protein n=1 Tax=Oryza sativa subsp. japonica TaxID=39947 RepID=A0A0P0XD85_ORYSJ|nr:Os08g0238650 [Oryza sativa Japonica Group]
MEVGAGLGGDGVRVGGGLGGSNRWWWWWWWSSPAAAGIGVGRGRAAVGTGGDGTWKKSGEAADLVRGYDLFGWSVGYLATAAVGS